MKWENYQLKDIANYWTGKVEASILDATNYISTDNLIPDRGGVVNSNYVPTSGNTNSFYKNDVLISNIRPYFKKIWFADKQGGCSNDVLVLRAKENVEPLFLYYQLSKDAFFDNMVAGSNGTKMPRGNKTSIMEFRLQIPPLPTQRKIASILSAYDDLIENNLKRIKLLEEAINLNYKDLISKEDKNFTYIKLNSFVDIISGFPFKSNYYNENGKHKIVTIKNVQDGFFVPIVTDRIDDVPDNMNKALFLTTGDVIMSLTGNVGRVCLVYGDDYVLNQRVVKLSAKEQIDQPFIYALVRDKQMLKILENLSNGAAQQNLSPIKMGELPIRYPNKSLREDFNKKVSPMIEMICKLNIHNTKLREARDILLPRLMNGQIEV
jgi:type I restriction enzyme S subunit